MSNRDQVYVFFSAALALNLGRILGEILADYASSYTWSKVSPLRKDHTPSQCVIWGTRTATLAHNQTAVRFDFSQTYPTQN